MVHEIVPSPSFSRLGLIVTCPLPATVQMSSTVAKSEEASTRAQSKVWGSEERMSVSSRELSARMMGMAI